MMSRAAWMLAGALLALPAVAFSQATVEIVIADGPGEGFNDPTPAAPVGGNTGTTIGQQRLNVFRFAADIWARTLTSSQVIRIEAYFDPLPCNANSAVLGGAAPYLSFRDVGAGRPGTWYPVALIEKIADIDIGPFLPPDLRYEVFAIFNSDLGKPGCFEGAPWHHGLDNASPNGRPNLATTVLHEIGHGVGFTVGPTDEETGERAQGYPSIWETRMLDLTANKLWLNMTDSERAASTTNTNNLVWVGGNVLAAVPSVLELKPEIEVLPPFPLGIFDIQVASFGPPLPPSGITDFVMPAIDTGGPSTLDACQPLDPQSAFSVRGRIALIDRGTCDFTVKVKNVQNAGAIGALIANNVPQGLPSMGGADPTITIPSVGISQALGNALREQLRSRGRSVSAVRVAMRRSPFVRSGTTSGFPRLYAPAVHEPGSSVSHWDISMTPDQLMEPFDSPTIQLSLVPPYDLTFPLLRDIGW